MFGYLVTYLIRDKIMQIRSNLILKTYWLVISFNFVSSLLVNELLFLFVKFTERGSYAKNLLLFSCGPEPFVYGRKKMGAFQQKYFEGGFLD